MIALLVSYAISGYAYTMPGHTPASGAHVCATNDKASLCESTNKDGSFNLEPLPAGTYTLEVDLTG
jgi:hypothetical protein